jgi:hypothetical protein
MATPSAPVISNAPLASPNTLEYVWYTPTSAGDAPIEDYYLNLTSQYGALTYNVGGLAGYYKVDGLSNATTYFTTIAASNAFGLGAPASFREFQPGSPPPSGVATAVATAVITTGDAAVVSWTPPITLPDATIFWYVVAGYTTSNALTPVLRYTAGGQTQSNLYITGLNPTLQYYFTVNAVNCPGWSVPLSTNTIEFVTLFRPTMTAGLGIWYDAADPLGTGTAPANGTSINTWADKSVNINNATAGVAASYVTDSTGNYLNFNGTSTYYNITSGAFIANQAYNIFIVERLQNITATQVCFYLSGNNTANNTNLLVRYYNNTGFFNWDQYGNSIEGAVPKFTTNTTQPTRLYSLMRSTTGRNLLLNGTLLTSDANTTLLSSWNGPNLGRSIENNVANYYYNGHMKEILFYTGNMTPFNRQKIEGYLAWKWGLQTQLPTNHPFYTAAPQSNSVFSPRSFSSLQLWLDASDISTVTLTSGRVTAWADKSGNGYNATTRYNGSNITYGAPINGVSTLTFVSTSISGTFSPSFTGSNTYAFFVGNHETTTNTYARVLAMGVSGQTDFNNTLYTNAFTRNNGTTQIIAERNSGVNAFVATTVTNTVPFLASAYNIPGSKGINANGGAITSNAGPSGPFNLTNYVIGGATNNTTTELFIGRIGEILVYTQPLSTQDRQTVEGYLAWKWGLQGSLPTTHPYRYNNPAIVNFTQISPTSFSGLGLWLDASQLTGLTNGGALTTWVDKSSNAYVGTASNGPTYITNSANGLPVVRFNGTSQLINFGSNILNISTNTGIAMFSVVKINNGSAGIVGKTVAGPLSGRWTTFRQTNTTKMLVQPDGDSTESMYSDSATSLQLVEGLWDRQTQYIYQNGLLRDSDAKASTRDLSNSAPLYVGAYPDSTGAGPNPGFYLDGDIGESLVYMTNITPFIRQQIEGYLTWKWGLQASLPVTHPYFTAPPQQAYTVFNPLLYSGLQLWLDASDTATLTGATAVSQWADKSGNSNNVFQAVSAQQPVRYTTPNGLSGLNFTASVGGTIDTGGQWFRGTFATPIINNQLSVFIVGSMNSATQQYGRAISLSQLTQNDFISGAGGANIARNSTANSLMMEANGASGPPTGAVSLATPFIAESIFDGTNQTAFVNGTQTGTRAFTANFNIARSGIGFLSYQGVNTNTDRWDGTINEVLVYNNSLDTGSRQTIEGYLAWKWGLQGLLPVTHPYALINPGNPTATPTVTTTGLLIRFDATTYSGSSAWTNTGSLTGTEYNATCVKGTPAKNAAGNGIVLGSGIAWTFANIGAQTSFTLSVWYKRTGLTTAQYATIISDGHNGTTNINMALLGTYPGPLNIDNTQISGGFYDVGTTSWKTSGITTLVQDVWYNLCLTFDNTSKSLNYYVNGVLQSSTPYSSFTPGTGGLPYRIGQSWGDTNTYVVGQIGQIFIYDRAITGSEVIQNFSATRYTFSV